MTSASDPIRDLPDESQASRASVPQSGAESPDMAARRPAGCPVAGLGASAGGLDALKRFFGAAPLDSGVAFVVIPHLDPRHDSRMVELLARKTTLPVLEIDDGVTVEPDHVYVIPPNKYVTLVESKLRLTAAPSGPDAPTAIDTFLCSLAADQGENGIAVILSGTSSHGTRGVKEIKLAGGLVIAQRPDSAEFDQMPRSAIDTGLVDFVLAPEEMPEKLVEFVRQERLRESSQTDGGVESEAWRQLQSVLAFVTSRTKFEFRFYRRNMLMRRVLRRMALCRRERLSDYRDYLMQTPTEVDALVKDLLISVTDFFRDAEAFQTLQEVVVPELVRRNREASLTAGEGERDGPGGRCLRIWTPACATGEEAYSIAMLFHERLSGEQLPFSDLRIFASDVDERALEVARQGVYSSAGVAHIPPQRLSRYFTKCDAAHWRVNKFLRDSITFAKQNLVTDAPFSKVDLICCRNLLIYLEPEIQAKLLRLFHFALSDGGFLMLGPSESIGREAGLFAPISQKWRIFRRIDTARRAFVEIPLVASAGRRRLRGETQVATVSSAGGFKELLQRAVLEKFAPAAVLMNSRNEIVSVLGPLTDYLEFPPGDLTRDLLSMVRSGLRTKVRAALQDAARTGKPVHDPGARVKRDEAYHPCTITVEPIRQAATSDRLFLVVFQDRSVDSEFRVDGRVAAEGGAPDDALLAQLERELQAARTDLQDSVAEFENSTEDLKASNEETMSMNEELQSANEELETSKEELQSLNEELEAANSQLHEKVEELDRATSDLLNLITSSDVATLFLDSQLCIKRFTPALAKLLRLRPGDIDRPLGDFTLGLVDESLLDDCRAVLERSPPIEHEVWTRRESNPDARCYLRRVLPYRASDERVVGVVVTFTDITARLASAAQARRLAGVLWDSNDAVTLLEFDGRVTAWNRGAERMYGYVEAEALRMNVLSLVPDERRNETLAALQAVSRGQAVAGFESQRVDRDGRLLDVELTFTAYRDESGQVIGVATTERDISERKRLERRVLEIADDEQRRIGQDLHDGAGQELTGLTLFAGTLVELLERLPRLDATRDGAHMLGAPELQNIRQTARRLADGLVLAGQHVQELSHEIMSVCNDGEGLRSALEELVATTAARQEIPCRFLCPEPVTVADAALATHLYRIAQEALNNALRHSRAAEIVISLTRAAQEIVLEIRDDGVGFDPESRARSAGTGPDRGFGLEIMSYRAGMFGGTCRASSQEGQGTTVRCTLPVPRGEQT